MFTLPYRDLFKYVVIRSQIICSVGANLSDNNKTEEDWNLKDLNTFKDFHRQCILLKSYWSIKAVFNFGNIYWILIYVLNPRNSCITTYICPEHYPYSQCHFQMCHLALVFCKNMANHRLLIFLIY